MFVVQDILRYRAIPHGDTAPPPPAVVISGPNAPGEPGQARKLERQRKRERVQ